MKRTIKVLSFALVFIMCFGVVSAFAKGNFLSNDKFYAEIPEGFKVNDSYGEDHYYLDDGDIIDYSGSFEIFVDGNFLFPDGIKKTEIEVIKERFKNFVYIENVEAVLDIKKAEKVNINGINACYIYGVTDDGISKESVHAYILTTKENLYIVMTTGSTDIDEKEPEFLKEVMSSFLVNGTYYEGEKLSKSHDFSKAEKYIDALERDVLTERYYSYHSGSTVVGLVFIAIILVFPILFVILIVKLVKTKRKLKEYKEFFGPIEQARMAMRQHYMQNSSYQPMQNNSGFYTNVPNMNMYNPNQPPCSQPQYQPTQPAQTNLSPEMQEFQNNNENKF